MNPAKPEHTPEEFKAGLDDILRRNRNANRVLLLIKLCEADLQRLRIASKEVWIVAPAEWTYQGIRLLSSREIPPGEVEITFYSEAR